MDRDTRMALLSRKYRRISPTIIGTTVPWREKSNLIKSGHNLIFITVASPYRVADAICHPYSLHLLDKEHTMC